MNELAAARTPVAADSNLRRIRIGLSSNDRKNSTAAAAAAAAAAALD